MVIPTEDYPMAYADFEDAIAKGHMGMARL